MEKIGTMDITDRHSREMRADVSGVPRMVDTRTGTEYEITGMTVKWTWTDRTGGYTHRDVSLYVRRVLKSGALGKEQYRRSAPAEFPEWLENAVRWATPMGLTHGVPRERGRDMDS